MLTPPKPRVRTLGTVLVLAFAALSSTGCGAIIEAANRAAEATPSTSPSPVPSRPPTTKEKLLRSVPTDDTKPYSFNLTNKNAPEGTTDVAGLVNPPGKGHETQVSVEDSETGIVTKMDVRVVDKRSWVRIRFENTEGYVGLPDLPEKWMLVDPAELKDPSSMPLEWSLDDEDAGGVEFLFLAVVDATETGAGTFTGTVDLTKASVVEAVDPSIVKALGPKAKAVPFSAALDPQGRIADLVLKVPASAKNKPFTHTIAYRGYGTATPVAPPSAAEVTKTPRAAYDLLNA